MDEKNYKMLALSVIKICLQDLHSGKDVATEATQSVINGGIDFWLDVLGWNMSRNEFLKINLP